MQSSVNSLKDQNNRRPTGISLLFLSWFYSGLLPKAPGTFGSLATVPLIYLLHYLQFNTYGLIALIGALFIAAVLVTQKVQEKLGLHDPGWIVIDEVVGMLLTWTFVQQIDWLSLGIVFGTFRLFDIVKIWPASYFDRLHHGFGTITDDVVSAIYAGIICQFIMSFI